MKVYFFKSHILLGLLLSTINITHAGKLHKAAKRGDVQKIRELIEEGTDVNKKPFFGSKTPLHLAAENGHATAVGALLEKGADVNMKTKKLMSALHFAVQNGHYDAGRTLVKNKADINSQSRCNFTPLHYGARNKHLAVVEYLLSNGANPKLEDNSSLVGIDIIDDDPYYSVGSLKPVFFAALNQDAASVRLFCKHITSSVKNETGYSLLHAAAHGIMNGSDEDSLEIISFLLKDGYSLTDECKMDVFNLIPLAFALNYVEPRGSEKNGWRVLLSLLIPEYKKKFPDPLNTPFCSVRQA